MRNRNRSNVLVPHTSILHFLVAQRFRLFLPMAYSSTGNPCAKVYVTFEITGHQLLRDDSASAGLGTIFSMRSTLPSPKHRYSNDRCTSGVISQHLFLLQR